MSAIIKMTKIAGNIKYKCADPAIAPTAWGYIFCHIHVKKTPSWLLVGTDMEICNVCQAE